MKVPDHEMAKRTVRPSVSVIFLVIGILLLTFAGCTVGPDYERPSVNVPASYRSEVGSTDESLANLPWWDVFQDQTLQKLVRTALLNNYDLRIAISRVEQAKAMEKETQSQFYPQLNYEANAGRGKNVTGGLPAPTGITGAVYGLDVNASWEIDLWGRVHRLSESARAQYLASVEARRDILISLIADVAQNYFQLLALDDQLAIAHESTESFGQSLRIFQERLQGGVASKLETSSAQALMENSAAMVPELERQISEQENQLSILLGLNPGAIEHPLANLDNQHLPEIPAGLPSSLLEQRPDVREAEQNLRSANAQVGVTVADFYPQLTLTGLFGEVSPELSAFSLGSANAWSVAAGLAGPLFHGGQLQAQKQQALAVREENLLQYQSTFLNALQEVANALVSRQKYGEIRQQQSLSVSSYREAVKIAFERYRLGNADYYEVLQEQQQLFPAENSLSQTKLNQLLVVVQLYRALGGGWQQEEKEVKNPPPVASPPS